MTAEIKIMAKVTTDGNKSTADSKEDFSMFPNDGMEPHARILNKDNKDLLRGSNEFSKSMQDALKRFKEYLEEDPSIKNKWD
ncbi:MAG: hypothetical protein ACP5FR_00585 [Candidatus Micrarchaeia archaeon]